MLNRTFLPGITGLVALVASAQAFSQDSFDEITVTATKRTQTLQEVPVAVSVVGAETIKQAQIIDILDLQTLVPALRVTQLQSSANTNFVIRGFGNGANNPGIEPSVGVFIDGVYRSRSASALSDLPDLERVEVLRGPQSTLFGKNASVGVISVVTARPSDELIGSVEASVGNYGQTILKGYVSGPIEDGVGFSLSAGMNQRDGFADNLATGQKYNERDRWNFRGQFLMEPTENLSIRFIGDYDEIDENCCGSANILAGPTVPIIFGVGGAMTVEDPFGRQAYNNYEPRNQIENSGFSMQADWDLADSTITSITAIRNSIKIEDFDADFTSADLISENFYDTEIDTFTQELRWSSNNGEKMDWMFGGYFFDEDVKYNQALTLGDDVRLYSDILASVLGGGTGAPGTLEAVEIGVGTAGIFAALEAADPGNPANGPTADFLGGIPCPPPTGVPACNSLLGNLMGSGQGVVENSGQSNTAYSFFTQFDFYVTDRTTLTVGLNYTKDEKDAFVNQTNTSVIDSLDFVDIGFQGALAALEAANPGSPANIPTATFISTNPCTPTSGPACNELLGLQALQVLPQFVNYPNSVENGQSEDDDLTYTVRFAFDMNDDVNLYASASTGFKATSWNLSRDARPFASDLSAIDAAGLTTPNLVAGTRYAEPEESTVYELGMKARWDTGTVNVAIFDQSIKGFQSNVFSGVGFNLANAGEQSTFGVEIDTAWYPTESLALTLGGIFLDPTYDSFVGGLGPDGPADLSGLTPAGIHEVSISASATYTADFSNGMTGYIRGDYVYESDVQIVDNVPKEVASREVNLLNASFGLSTESGWDFAVWGRNLTDDEFLLSAFPSVFQAGSLSGYPNPPRTYGVTVRKNF
jgi:outer membrane receptor protein involved in Fe transport